MGSDGEPTASRVAVLSDVHGNLTAFRAVLDDIDRRGVDTIVGLGDVVGKGPRGSACVALARERCAVTVQGNWDEWLGTEPHRVRGDDPESQRAVRWWFDELLSADRAWLRGLPFSATALVGGEPVRFVHASTVGVWTRIGEEHSAAAAATFFGSADRIPAGPVPSVVCYGDLHLAYEERTPDGLLVNVGSVGNPLDEPLASYVVLEAGAGGVEARFHRVEYDVEAELAVAEAVSMPELPQWERELREAHYRGLDE